MIVSTPGPRQHSQTNNSHFFSSKFQEFNAHRAVCSALALGQKGIVFLQELYGWHLLHCLFLVGRGLLTKCSPILGLNRAPRSPAPRSPGSLWWTLICTYSSPHSLSCFSSPPSLHSCVLSSWVLGGDFRSFRFYRLNYLQGKQPFFIQILVDCQSIASSQWVRGQQGFCC